MIYAINYDLTQPGKNYNELHNAIKNLGDWWHYLGSTWLVETNLNAKGIWDQLAAHVDESDRILVIGVTRDYSGWLTKDAWAWINTCLNKMAA